MRLLVYGGNQHGERRRIGVWSDAVGSQAFQDTYGSSMRSVSFGVGIVDDSPFLILRKIENFGERAYPLVVLFDPGRETWIRFKWNGADLLWALFGKPDFPGLKLLTEPESFHTDEHLEKLLSEVDESIPPESDGEPIADPELLLDLWTGAVFAESPLIAHVDLQLTGFSSRPDLKELSDLLNKLPSSLRCGKGWLFGGRDRHAESLGAHLVFDDGKLDAPTDADRKSLVQYQRQGHDLRAALEPLNQSANDENSGFKKFLSKPVAEWADSSVEALPHLLEDIVLLNELKERGESQVVNRMDDDKLFARLNKRLQRNGRLNEDITAAANDFITQHSRTRTDQETIFILTQAAGQTNAKLEKDELDNLDGNAAYSFFIEQKLFPADATGLMPPNIPVRVSRKLLEEVDRAEKIPEIFRREAEFSPGYEPQDLQELLQTAVDQSAEKTRGLRDWSKLFKHAELGEDVQRAVRTKVFQRVNPEYPDSLADYLVLGDDAGGEQLLAFKPALKEVRTLQALLLFIIEQLDNPREAGLDKAAREWLNQLARSELRLEISLRGKDQIADRLNHGLWENYIFLRRAYRGDRRLSASSRPADEQERKFLAQELAEAAEEAKSAPVDFIPALDQLAKLLAPDYLGALVEALVGLHPNLAGANGMNWVESWLRLTQHKSLNPSQLSACLEKYRAELVRLILETDTTLKGQNQLKALEPEDLTVLFRGLLVQGEAETDHRFRLRLAEVLNTFPESSKEPNKPLQSVIEEILSDTAQQELLTRRLLGRQDVSAIKKRLTREQKDRFKALFETKSLLAVDSIKNKLLTIFTSGERGSLIFDSIGRLEAQAMKSGDDVFRQALASALEELTTRREKLDAFFSGAASNSDCFGLYKRTLTRAPDKKLLTQLSREKNERDRIATIKQSLLHGSSDRDRELKDKLASVLKEPNDTSLETLNRVMKEALSSDDSFALLIRRFVPVGPSSMFGHRCLEVKHDKLFITLFEVMSPEIGREFLGRLWKHYNAEHGNESPIMSAAREALKKLEHSKSAAKNRGSRKPGTESDTWLISFDDSLIRYLAHNPTLQRQAVELEFGAGRVASIESLVREYVPDAQNEEKTEAVHAAATKSWGTRLKGWIKRDDSQG